MRTKYSEKVYKISSSCLSDIIEFCAAANLRYLETREVTRINIVNKKEIVKYFDGVQYERNGNFTICDINTNDLSTNHITLYLDKISPGYNIKPVININNLAHKDDRKLIGVVVNASRGDVTQSGLLEMLLEAKKQYPKHKFILLGEEHRSRYRHTRLEDWRDSYDVLDPLILKISHLSLLLTTYTGPALLALGLGIKTWIFDNKYQKILKFNNEPEKYFNHSNYEVDWPQNKKMETIKIKPQKEAKVLAWYICFGQKYAELLKMSIESLICHGFNGDIVVLTDDKLVIDIDYPKLLKINIKEYISENYGVDDVGSCPEKCWAVKSFINEVVDISKYDYLLYVDSDVMCNNNYYDIIQNCLSKKDIVVQCDVTLSRKRGYNWYGLADHAERSEMDDISIGAGLIILRVNDITKNFLKEWRTILLKNMLATDDQNALSTVIHRKFYKNYLESWDIIYHGLNNTRVSFNHYCQGNVKEQTEHYNRLLEKGRPKIEVNKEPIIEINKTKQLAFKLDRRIFKVSEIHI